MEERNYFYSEYSNYGLEYANCKAKVFSPLQALHSSNSRSYSGAPRAVKLKYLIPTMGTNDNDYDTIYIGIYSDYLDEMFVCGAY